MSTDVSLSWDQFKTQIAHRNLTIQYVYGNNKYYLLAFDNLMQIICSIPTDGNSDQLDFEANYKDQCNTMDRLKVDALISSSSSGISPTISKNYKFDISNTSILITSSSYSTVYNYTGSGLFYGFQLSCNNVHIKMKLTIDDIILFDFDGSLLSAFGSLLGNNQICQSGLFFSQIGNSYDFSPRYSIPYSTSLKLEVKSSDGSNHNINAWFVNSTKES